MDLRSAGQEGVVHAAGDDYAPPGGDDAVSRRTSDSGHYELSGAAVPFRFDVHALIFSKDAVGLESRLHQEFASRRVNRVNSREEFFRVTPAEVKAVLEHSAGEHLVEFNEVAEAIEWRSSTTGESGER
ncbi:GIY-YIG nuclease family protein [Streptomyces bambusae]|uniref:Bacteriophage T5 Orf172 DNA-binding domain-containing protein n=1 Tax=Streptomyces bambusae TaxID=1550616 RepID=A0ABS6YZZ7_9ACTN|nr:GIY-YIG nuclease family protein [Streptomyces bambusae]MBW5481060.1 hypothetical protein [Streptomyces bambusae]